MKIEFLYKDNSYKAVINKINKSLNLEQNGIIYTPVVQAGLNLFSFEKENDDETTARELDKIKKEILESLSLDDLFVITDGTSNYFCQRLYPLVANFERNLRKILYIASLKSHDATDIKLCRKIHELEFSDIYQMLFSDVNYVKEARTIVNSKSPELSKHDMMDKLNSISEHNLWNKLFNEEYSYIPNNFLSIKDGRNKVMHSRDVSYKNFSEMKNRLEKCDKIFKSIESQLLEKENFGSNENSNNISNALLLLGKAAVDIYSSEKTRAVMAMIGKIVLEALKAKDINMEPDEESSKLEDIS